MKKRPKARHAAPKIIYLPVAQVEAMPLMCAWDGCTESYQGDQPPDWNCLLVFWSPGPISNIAEINQNFWPRDGVLCPKHSAALEKLLKPIHPAA
jgi:hypothetical protein